jgi:hypothetical protein
MQFNVGDRVKFVEERNGYTVQAVSASGRWVACTKPFPLKRTVIYSMLDLREGLRGVDNTIGNSHGYETREDCEEAVALFDSGALEFSHRNRPIPLVVPWHRPAKVVGGEA